MVLIKTGDLPPGILASDEGTGNLFWSIDDGAQDMCASARMGSRVHASQAPMASMTCENFMVEEKRRQNAAAGTRPGDVKSRS